MPAVEARTHEPTDDPCLDTVSRLNPKLWCTVQAAAAIPVAYFMPYLRTLGAAALLALHFTPTPLPTHYLARAPSLPVECPAFLVYLFKKRQAMHQYGLCTQLGIAMSASLLHRARSHAYSLDEGMQCKKGDGRPCRASQFYTGGGAQPQGAPPTKK